MNNDIHQAESIDPSNFQYFYGTGQQISMFDHITENDAEIEDEKAVI